LIPLKAPEKHRRMNDDEIWDDSLGNPEDIEE
jgi:hypothetical protein